MNLNLVLSSVVTVLLFRKYSITFSVVEMVKKLQQESIKRPVRQSHRTRTLNTRLSTPPKILLDMLKDHSSCTAKKSLLAVEDMEKISKYNAHQVLCPFHVFYGKFISFIFF